LQTLPALKSVLLARELTIGFAFEHDAFLL
jgi:hypothetical protein